MANSIRPFHRPEVATAPEVHPAALAAAQLLVVNDISEEDFAAAVDFFKGLMPGD
jgi:hypothetical protein